MEELLAVMKKLPAYCNDFLEIIIQTLTDYYEACSNSYKGACCLSKVRPILFANVLYWLILCQYSAFAG